MKTLCLVVAGILLLSIGAAAQNPITNDSPYQLNYYSNRNNSAGADQILRIVNDGVTGSPISGNEGRLCANIYVFDAAQEMIECCHCVITANGMRTLSVLKDLTQNPLTGFPAPDNGVIKILGTVANGCSESSPTALSAGLLAWQTHVEQPTNGTFVTSVTQYGDGTLSASEFSFLGEACSFVQYLGSGKGVCGCGTGS